MSRTGDGDIAKLSSDEDLRRAAAIAALAHGRLRSGLPFLPPRDAAYFLPKLKWLAGSGILLGLRRDGELSSFLGGFLVDDFRNSGPGCYSPEWGAGSADPGRAFDEYRALYRAIAPEWIRMGARIHALSAYSGEAGALEALSLTGFGRIVMDAARPTAEVAASIADRAAPPGLKVRWAEFRDSGGLALLSASLADHIAASPVLMPDTRGLGESGWRAWLSEPDAAAFVAEDGEAVVGYIKAQDPQMDVSDAVHAPDCLAINGMYCLPSLRGRGVGAALLSALARHARETGKGMMSVDCETANLEAYAFWPRFFKTVAWSFERRV